jgi:hypothetical protein
MTFFSYTIPSDCSKKNRILISEAFIKLKKKFPQLDFKKDNQSNLIIDLDSEDISTSFNENNSYILKMSPAHQRLSLFNTKIRTIPHYKNGFHLSELTLAIQKLCKLDDTLPEVQLLKDCTIENNCWIFTPYVPQNNLEATLTKETSVSVKRLHQLVTKAYPEMICSDLMSDFVQKENSNQYLFFGSFIDHYIESLLYTKKSIRINTLSSVAKQTLEKLFSIKGIGVLSRKKLFPPKSDYVPLNKSGVNWVYSGRITEDKNISLLLYFFYYWQKEYDPKSTLTLFGPLQTRSKNYFCNKDRGNFDKELNELINSLDWVTPPHFLGSYPDDCWHSYIPQNSCFINFSTYCKDDFGVSSAQYLQHHSNALLSQWGGHVDIQGDGIHKVDVELILSNDLTLNEKAQLLAKEFAQKPLTFSPPMENHIKSGPIDFKRLKESIDDFAKKFGKTHLFLNRGLSIELLETFEGQKLIRYYSLLFRGILDQREMIFVHKNEIKKQSWINNSAHIFTDPILYKLAKKISKN